MLDMGLVGWIVVGFIAGAISGALVGGTTARGCLPNVVVGILGGVIGGWLATRWGSSQRHGLHRGRRGRAVLGAWSSCASSSTPWKATDDRLATDGRVDRGVAQSTRPYSPGLEGVIAGETSLSHVDGERGRLLYRGYRIGDLVERGTYPGGRQPAVDRRLGPAHRLPTAPIPEPSSTVLRALPSTTKPMDALRTAVSAWGATQELPWPPTVDQARAADRVLAVGAGGVRPASRGPGADRPGSVARPRRGVPVPAHRRRGRTPARPGRSMRTSSSVPSTASTPRRSRPGSSSSTRSDIASAVTGAIGTMKGPLHGGAPSEVVDQLSQVGSAEHAEAWIRDALDRGERLMGFGHRVYRAYDPRAAALAQGRRGDASTSRTGSSWRSRSRMSRCASSPRSTRNARSRPTSSSTRRRC